MNYSTTTELLNNVTVQSLSHEELSEKFTSLKHQYEGLSKQYELSQQDLYDLRKNNQFATELNNHLTAEVEAWQKNEVKIKQEYDQRIQNLQYEIDELRQEKWKESENHANTIESLQNRLRDLEEDDQNKSSCEKSVTQFDSTKFGEEMKRIEDENRAIRDMLKEQNTELVNKENSIISLTNQVKCLEEHVESLKSNLECKKSELLAVTEMLHSAQEDLCGSNAELQLLKNTANVHAVKGNSIFAEVDDKRQEMLKELSQMKEKIHQLNRKVISQQAEIDALRREKKTLWEEYAGKSSQHDAVLARAYERRITDLEKQNNQLQREIAQWYDNNLDPKLSNITQWVSGVLDYYKEENHRLNNEFAASSVDNLFKEQKLRDLQRQLVTWRAKAVEANATVAELETKLQVKISESDKNNTEVWSNNEIESAKKLSYIKTESIYSEEKENMSPENKSNDEKIIIEPNDKPGILVTRTEKKNSTKKTTFQ